MVSIQRIIHFEFPSLLTVFLSIPLNELPCADVTVSWVTGSDISGVFIGVLYLSINETDSVAEAPEADVSDLGSVTSDFLAKKSEVTEPRSETSASGASATESVSLIDKYKTPMKTPEISEPVTQETVTSAQGNSLRGIDKKTVRREGNSKCIIL